MDTLSRPVLPSLHIDGIAHALHHLTVLDGAGRLPGGFRWVLEFGDEAAARHFGYGPPLHHGRPSPMTEAQVLQVLGRMLRGGGSPRFCVASVDCIAVRDGRVQLTGRCAPLIADTEASGRAARASG